MFVRYSCEFIAVAGRILCGDESSVMTSCHSSLGLNISWLNLDIKNMMICCVPMLAL